MMWGYMPRVEAYFPSQYYDKYGRIFGSIWVASAYKGAQGELATATKMAERLANHVSWVKVMSNKVADGILKFEGVALTGWSRYDHFLPICELLPQAIPHMALALQVLKSGGELDDSEKLSVENKLGCNGVNKFLFENFKLIAIY
jgi:hexosaminidase